MRPSAVLITATEGSTATAQLTQDCISAEMALVQRQLIVEQACQWGNTELIGYLTSEQTLNLPPPPTGRNHKLQCTAIHTKKKEKKTLEQDTIYSDNRKGWEYNSYWTRTCLPCQNYVKRTSCFYRQRVKPWPKESVWTSLSYQNFTNPTMWMWGMQQ